MAASTAYGPGGNVNVANLQGLDAPGGSGHRRSHGDDHASTNDDLDSDDVMTNADSLTTDPSSLETDDDGRSRAGSLGGRHMDSDGTDSIDDNASVDAMTISSKTQTLHSSIYDHEFEYGRRYHHYRTGLYPLPNDQAEQEREVTLHFLHMDITEGRLFQAPIDEYPQRILDLCTGTGQWALAIADEYPSAEVVGIDLSPIQPLMVPPNVRFILDDVEDEWIDRGGYDLIHMRYASMFIRDMNRLVWNIYDHLKPGAWVELCDFSYHVGCDDGTMPEDYAFNRFTIVGHQALVDYGVRPSNPDEFGDFLYRAGFQNVQSSVIKVPIGPWPEDPKQKAIGESHRENLISIVSVAAKPISHSGFTTAEIEVFLAGVRKSLYDVSVHSYMTMKTFWAQK